MRKSLRSNETTVQNEGFGRFGRNVKLDERPTVQTLYRVYRVFGRCTQRKGAFLDGWMDAHDESRIRKRPSWLTVPVKTSSVVDLPTIIKCLRWLRLLMQAHKSFGKRARPRWGKVYRVVAYLRRALYDAPISVAPSRLRALRCREFRLREAILRAAMDEGEDGKS